VSKKDTQVLIPGETSKQELVQQEIRSRLLLRRKKLSSDEVLTLSCQITKRLLQSFENLESQLNSEMESTGREKSEDLVASGLEWPQLKVGLYRRLSTEVDLSELETFLCQKKARIFYPRVRKDQSEAMEFVEMSLAQSTSGSLTYGASSLWEKSSYGMMQPSEDLPAAPVGELDIVFVPGVAWSPSGDRIGRGGGFYDRYLQLDSNSLRISIAYDFQVVSAIPPNPWDQSVHWIVSEAREFKLPFVQAWWQKKLSRKK